MTIKDWKQVRKGKGLGTVSFIQKRYGEEDAIVIEYNYDKRKWDIFYGKRHRTKKETLRTKSAALKFAKSYMRKH